MIYVQKFKYLNIINEKKEHMQYFNLPGLYIENVLL